VGAAHAHRSRAARRPGDLRRRVGALLT
jgi:hypothetical protein